MAQMYRYLISANCLNLLILSYISWKHKYIHLFILIFYFYAAVSTFSLNTLPILYFGVIRPLNMANDSQVSSCSVMADHKKILRIASSCYCVSAFHYLSFEY